MEGAIDQAIGYGREKLGFDSLRSYQVDVIKKYMEGNDVILCSPTGTGKSLTFEIAPFVFKKYHNLNNVTVIVISPLVALMTKQADKCREFGLNSVYLKGEGDQNNEDEQLITDLDSISIQDMRSGEIDIIFASPETILGSHRELVQELTKKKILKTIFIDEAHCISKYGKSKSMKKGQKKVFRPAYGKLGELRALAPDIPVVALTATATKATLKIIIQEMCMADCKQVILSPNKENIKYWQLNTSGVISQDFTWLVSLLREKNIETPRMLIFFRKIKQLGDLFDFLRSELGEAAYATGAGVENNYKNRLFDMFHNKTNSEIKQLVCQSFMEPCGKKRVVLCSTSFSMGLDLKGVETVIHLLYLEKDLHFLTLL